MKESEERAAARDAVDRAVKRYVEVVAQENEITDHPIVLGWAGFAEYTSLELESHDATGSVTLVPDGQNASTSRGLMHFGADAFSRAAATV